MFIFFTALLVVADQLSKVWAARTFVLGDIGRYLGFGVYLTYVQNTGAAFGMLPNGTLLLAGLSALVSLGLFVFLLRRKQDMSRLQQTAFTLILAGAVGNMIDRFRLGYVIDFIHFKLPRFDFPVFNLADSCVVIGAALLIGSSLVSQHRSTADLSGEQEVSSTRSSY